MEVSSFVDGQQFICLPTPRCQTPEHPLHFGTDEIITTALRHFAFLQNLSDASKVRVRAGAVEPAHEEAYAGPILGLLAFLLECRAEWDLTLEGGGLIARREQSCPGYRSVEQGMG